MDNYSPIPVETEEEYRLVVSRFPFHDAEIEKVCTLGKIKFTKFYFFCFLITFFNYIFDIFRNVIYLILINEM